MLLRPAVAFVVVSRSVNTAVGLLCCSIAVVIIGCSTAVVFTTLCNTAVMRVGCSINSSSKNSTVCTIFSMYISYTAVCTIKEDRVYYKNNIVRTQVQGFKNKDSLISYTRL